MINVLDILSYVTLFILLILVIPPSCNDLQFGFDIEHITRGKK